MANHHSYHLLLGPILKDRPQCAACSRSAVGTNNLDVVSNMGSEGRLGLHRCEPFATSWPDAAMLTAPTSDRRILFREERIDDLASSATTDRRESCRERWTVVCPAIVDLVIDDGLHVAHANLRSLKFGLGKITVGRSGG